MQTYSAAQIDMVLEWIDKYFEVNALINKVFGNDNLENDSAMPSFENEIEYQRLRFWFRKNHEKFVPIWNEFCLSHGYSSQYMDNTSEMEYRNNPFLFIMTVIIYLIWRMRWESTYLMVLMMPIKNSWSLY